MVLGYLRDFAIKHRRKIAVFVVVAAILELCFSIFAPPRVEIREKFVEVAVERVVEVEKVVEIEKKVFVKQKSQRVNRTIARTEAPDGTKTETISESIGVDLFVKEDFMAYKDRVSSLETELALLRAKETVQKPVDRPWKASVMVGIDLLSGLEPVIGVSVDRRLVGPFRAGLWGDSRATVGISMGVDF